MKKHLYLFPFLVLSVFYLYLANAFEIHDFANYYFGGEFLKSGAFDISIFYPEVFNKEIAKLGYQEIFANYAPNSPFISILFIPLSCIGITASKLLFNIISTILFFLAIIRINSILKIDKIYLILIPFVFFIPLKNNILFGQVYFLLFFLLSEGYISYRKEKYLKMSVFWSIAILIKVFPVILLGFLLFNKKYKAAVFLTLSCLALLLLSLLIIDSKIWFFYFTDILPRANNGEIAGAFVDNFQSMYMFLKHLFVYDEFYNPNSIINSPSIFRSSLLFFKIGLITILYFISKSKQNDFFIFSFCFLIGTLISPYGSTYGLIVLLFLYISIANSSKIPKEYKLVMVLLLLISSNFGPIISQLLFPFNYIRLLSLLTILFILIWLTKEDILLGKIMLPAIIFASIFYFIPLKKDTSNYFLKDKVPIATYQYTLKDSEISIFYWDKKGDNQRKLKANFSFVDSISTKIIDNQIFYKNQQLTFNKSNKKKPVLLDDEKIIYLTDEDQGFGFYSLKYITIK